MQETGHAQDHRSAHHRRYRGCARPSVSCRPASAVPRHKAVVAKAGALIRVSNHTHFKFSTCQALSIPKVVIRQKPTKGTLNGH